MSVEYAVGLGENINHTLGCKITNYIYGRSTTISFSEL